MKVEVHRSLTIKSNLIYSFHKLLMKINRPNHSSLFCWRSIPTVSVIMPGFRIFSFPHRGQIFSSKQGSINWLIWSTSCHVNTFKPLNILNVSYLMYPFSEDMLPYIAEFFHSYRFKKIITGSMLNAFHDPACFSINGHHCAVTSIQIGKSRVKWNMEKLNLIKEILAF